jgi:hypothetical protein
MMLVAVYFGANLIDVDAYQGRAVRSSYEFTEVPSAIQASLWSHHDAISNSDPNEISGTAGPQGDIDRDSSAFSSSASRVSSTAVNSS